MNQQQDNQPLVLSTTIRGDMSISLIILGISGTIFMLPELSLVGNQDSMLIFFINYLISCIYYWIVHFSLPKEKRVLSHQVFTVLLFLMSAYSLNREMSVFLESITWQSVLLVLSGLAMLLSCFFDVLPRLVNFMVSFVLGISAMLFFYLACYVFPLYFISVPLLLALGISIHSFVPIMVLIVICKIVMKMSGNHSLNIKFFIGGTMTALITTVLFIFSWVKLNHDAKTAYNQHSSQYIQSYPSWISLAQRLPDDWLTKRFLKTDLVYTQGESMSFMPSFDGKFDEKRVHDPLVMTAQFFSKVEIDRDDKIKVLQSMHDARHQAQEQLWRGDRLSTSNILTNIRIYPAYRLAYTEKTLDIHYTSKDRWNDPQEAVYTFYVPEGAVVSSLSLWINGKEEKGYLTTKAKADSAYKTIVGVESRVLARDPSVVHWQEGNMISLRVFPCTPEADRKVKIGFSSPLLLKDKQLVYQSIYFKGAPQDKADETIQVKIEGYTDNYADKKVDLPWGFEEKPDHFYLYQGSFKSYWEIELEHIPLANTQFAFGGKSYQVKPYQKTNESINIKDVYLDLNSSWSKSEIEKVLKMCKTQNIYLWNEYKMIAINEKNIDIIDEAISKLNFSLFPLYQIKNVENALLITKNDKPAPTLEDLKKSVFADNLIKYVQNKAPLRVFSLNENLAPYLKTLKELREIQCETGAMEDLEVLIDKKQFAHNQENEHTVIIEPAQMKIEETQGSTAPKSDAPDHLLRLFAYHHLMQKVSANYFKETFVTEETIKEAQIANIVSPLSSLVVLETEKDYKRFGIEKNEDSLGNASMHSDGAVPEPEEWALIILCLVAIAYTIFIRKG